MFYLRHVNFNWSHSSIETMQCTAGLSVSKNMITQCFSEYPPFPMGNKNILFRQSFTENTQRITEFY